MLCSNIIYIFIDVQSRRVGHLKYRTPWWTRLFGPGSRPHSSARYICLSIMSVMHCELFDPGSRPHSSARCICLSVMFVMHCQLFDPDSRPHSSARYICLSVMPVMHCQLFPREAGIIQVPGTYACQSCLSCTVNCSPGEQASFKCQVHMPVSHACHALWTVRLGEQASLRPRNRHHWIVNYKYLKIALWEVGGGGVVQLSRLRCIFKGYFLSQEYFFYLQIYMVCSTNLNSDINCKSGINYTLVAWFRSTCRV